MRVFRLVLICLLLAAAGCGTSKWTDTGRSATEQLLITDAMDRAVSDLDFRALAGKTAYIDSTALKKVSDSEYLVSCLRQHMLASGCMVKDNKVDADYIVEVRAGAVGTDRNDVLYGVPSVNIPTVVPVTGIPSQIPEMPFVKKTDQRAVVKLSLFAYNQKTGRPIWQSGAVPEESTAKAVWVLGAGPFQRGTIYDGMEFAGDRLDIPLVDLYHPEDRHVSVADEAYFVEPDENVAPEEKTATAIAAAEDSKKESKPKTEVVKDKPDRIVPVGHAEPSEKKDPPAATSPPLSPAPVGASPTTPQGAPAGVGPSPARDPAPPGTTSHTNPPAALPAGDLAPALEALRYGAEPQLLRPSAVAPQQVPVPGQ